MTVEQPEPTEEQRKRGCVETSARCICIPCAVSCAVSRAACCPPQSQPPAWNPRFAMWIALMKAVSRNIVRRISCIRCLTDTKIPLWLPTLPDGINVIAQKARDGGCPCAGEWVSPATMPDPRTEAPSHVILYFHGGAFALCKPSTHRGITMQLVHAIEQLDGQDFCLFAVGYRRPPECPYPTPVQDCVATYKWLLERLGEDAASRIVLAGDSAGGALAVLVLAQCRKDGLPMPSGAILLSPWVDLVDTVSGSWQENRDVDYLPKDMTVLLSDTLVEKSSLTKEEVSATNQGLDGFPPLHVMTGEKEVFRDQILVFCRKASDAGVDVRCTVEAGMVHAFVAFADLIFQETTNRWFRAMSDFALEVTQGTAVDTDGQGSQTAASASGENAM